MSNETILQKSYRNIFFKKYDSFEVRKIKPHEKKYQKKVFEYGVGVEIAAGCRQKPTRFLKKATGLTSDLGKKADLILLQSVKYFVSTIQKTTVSMRRHFSHCVILTIE